MINICTVGDKKYLLKGLALYQSLCKTAEGKFLLHWLCIDKETYDILFALKINNIILYNLSWYEERYPVLQQAKNNPASSYGDQYSQYCWSLTPWFINHLLSVHKYDTVIYADTDVYFYNSPYCIVDAMQNRSVAIHTHRFSGLYRQNIDTGWYNVGVMVFKAMPPGLTISKTWADWVLTTGHEFYKSHGTCGDQKYLELFIPKFGEQNVLVFDEQAGICHKAPWCTEDCAGDQQTLFYHFSHFIFDLDKNTWQDSWNSEWNPSGNPAIKEKYYDPYFEAIKQSQKMIHG